MTAEGPRFEATPQNPDLLRWIGIQVLLLVIAWVIGMVVRRLLASRMTMSTASATLTGLGGLWGGLLVAGWIFSTSDMWRPAMIGVAARRRHRRLPDRRVPASALRPRTHRRGRQARRIRLPRI